jgi:hypothetical protein
MKVASNSSTSNLGQIDIIGTNTLGSAFSITPNMFETSNRYQYIDIPFTVNGSSANIEFRGIGFNSGITTTYLDHIIVRPLAKDYTHLIPESKTFNVYYHGVATPRFTINTSGNIGVGVASPRAALDLGSANNRGQVILLGETGANIRVGFGLNSSNAGMRIFTLNQSDQQIELGGISNTDGTTWTRNHRFGVAGGNTWLQEQGGNVGINVTSPNAKLNVKGSDGGPSTSPQEDLIHVGGNELGNSGGYAGIRLGGTGGTSYGVYIRAVKKGNYGNFWDDSLTFSVTRTSTETTIDEVMRITSDGRVGIGTTTPGNILEIGGTNVNVYPKVNRSSTGYEAGWKLSTGGSDNWYLGLRSADGVGSYHFYSYTTNSSVVAVQNDGNVGIGTPSPASRLHVSKAGNTAGGTILMGVANDSTGKWSYLVSTQYNSSTHPQGYSLIGGFSDASSNYVVIGGSIYEANPATEIQFWTHTAVSHSTGGSKKMTITSVGNVGIGTATPSYLLDVAGTIRATGDVIAYSDARVKDNVETITNALTKVTSLRGVTYTRKDNEDKSEKVGVIAQEVLPILPEVVQQDTEGNYSVAYGNMVGVLIEAIKEQQKQIDELKYLLQTQNK